MKIRNLLLVILDPEHPYTLEQLSVVREDLIKVRYNARRVCTIEIEFTPTGRLQNYLHLTSLINIQYPIAALLH